MSLRVFDDLRALSHAAAEVFVLRARDAMRESGTFNVALAGGSTPKRMYQLLAEEPYRNYLSWDKVHIFFGDERFVPISDPNSNEGLARQELLNKVPIPQENIHGMFEEGVTPPVAASSYEKLLKSQAPDGMDLAFLGMGDDGHTASLFPGIPELEEEEKWVAPTTSPKGVPQRITMTIPYLAKSKWTLFMVSGTDKKIPLIHALSENPNDWPPSGVVGHRCQEAHWYVDEAAFRAES